MARGLGQVSQNHGFQFLVALFLALDNQPKTATPNTTSGQSLFKRQVLLAFSLLEWTAQKNSNLLSTTKLVVPNSIEFRNTSKKERKVVLLLAVAQTSGTPPIPPAFKPG